MSDHELAQLNIATLKAPIDSPLLADFVANLDRVNALAERSAGYRWRLQSDDGDATAFRPFGEDVIVNMSTWRDPQALRNFVFSPGHMEIMRRRGEWFERSAEATMVLWWVPCGHRPTLAEAGARLEQLRRNGASAHAFSFRTLFPPPDTSPPAVASGFLDDCPAT
jgi:hypothetical protein